MPRSRSDYENCLVNYAGVSKPALAVVAEREGTAVGLCEGGELAASVAGGDSVAVRVQDVIHQSVGPEHGQQSALLFELVGTTYERECSCVAWVECPKRAIGQLAEIAQTVALPDGDCSYAIDSSSDIEVIDPAPDPAGRDGTARRPIVQSSARRSAVDPAPACRIDGTGMSANGDMSSAF